MTFARANPKRRSRLPVATAYMLLAGAHFCVTYSVANWAAAQYSHVSSRAFGWERRIPFLAWTIVPYWSIDLLYLGSFFVCRSRDELRRHFAQLLTAQTISFVAFLVFPLRFGFARPETTGIFGAMFATLGAFDRPFNQAPSLHVSLAIILAARYSRHLRGFRRTLLNGWFAMVGVAALTTYQHHWIDVPTGAWVGLLVLAIYPEVSCGAVRQVSSAGSARIAAAYGAAATLLALAAMWFGSWALWLLWPAGACLFVAVTYARGDPARLGKRDGGILPAMKWLLAPYFLAARLNARCWRIRAAAPSEIADGVWIGPLSSASGRVARFGSVVDLTAELPARLGSAQYANVPMLDLVPPSAQQLDQAVAAIQRFAAHRPTLVCCALGYGRSATAVAAWLVATGRATSAEHAIALIERQRRTALSCATRANLAAWAAARICA